MADFNASTFRQAVETIVAALPSIMSLMQKDEPGSQQRMPQQPMPPQRSQFNPAQQQGSGRPVGRPTFASQGIPTKPQNPSGRPVGRPKGQFNNQQAFRQNFTPGGPQ